MQKINYHNAVLKNEAIEGLNIKANGVYVDVTFGGGGHSRAILQKLGDNGTLISFDQDDDAKQNVPDDSRLIFLKQNFKYLKNNLRYQGFKKVDGILADLGVSSHQFDEEGRGFSFRFQGNLDMRMNMLAKRTAADILNQYTEEKLTGIFKTYGEVRNAGLLTHKIIEERNRKHFNDINRFAGLLQQLAPKKAENQYMARVFQALRIEVNSELQALKQMLLQCIEVLKPTGRLVVISYHSLEDRLVKNLIKAGNFEGKQQKDFYGNIYTPLKAVNKRIITPGEEEIKNNNRARSARMRIAEKV